MENILKVKGMLCNVKMDTKANIQYNALEWKVTVFSTIYFPASSHPVFVFVFDLARWWCQSPCKVLEPRGVTPSGGSRFL